MKSMIGKQPVEKRKLYHDPKTNRFAKGNPGGGRPVGKRNFEIDFDEAVDEIAKEEGISYSEARKALLKTAYREAKKGNFNFYKDVTDRTYGEAKKNVEVGATEELKDLLLRINNVLDEK